VVDRLERHAERGHTSLVDTTNQVLLLFGLRRAARPASRSHPFGHGMEIYFWGFVVALMIFALGGAFSVYEGISRLSHPEPITDAWVNFAVLGVSMVIEFLTLRVAWRGLRERHPRGSALKALRGSKDPSIFAIFCEDAAALAGLSLALVGVSLAYFLEMPVFDGIASIAIGGVLVLTAIFLARETLSLMTGESASAEILEGIRSVLQADSRVAETQEILSMHLGPEDILVAASIDFRDDMVSDEIEDTARDITRKLKACHPSVGRVFLRPARLEAAPAR